MRFSIVPEIIIKKISRYPDQISEKNSPAVITEQKISSVMNQHSASPRIGALFAPPSKHNLLKFSGQGDYRLQKRPPQLNFTLPC